VVIPAAAVNAPHGRDRVWFVAHRNSNRWPNGNIGEGTGKGKERGKFNVNYENGSMGLTADTDSDGQHRRNCKHEVFASEGRLDALGDIGTGGEHGITADTGNKGLERGAEFGGFRGSWKERNKQPSGCFRTDWQNFPTEPPVCGGDDGISRELDGITFSKWRNESIKAYGNAVCPQVVFQLFKAIETIDRQEAKRLHRSGFVVLCIDDVKQLDGIDTLR